MKDIIKNLIKNKKFIVLASTIVIFVSGLGLGIGIKRSIEKKEILEPRIVATTDEESKMVVAGEDATDKVNDTVKNKELSKESVKKFLINHYAFSKAMKEFSYNKESSASYVASGVSRLVEETRNLEVLEIEPLKTFYPQYKEELKAYADTMDDAILEKGLFEYLDISIYASDAYEKADYTFARINAEAKILEYEYDLDIMESDEVNNEAQRLIAIGKGEEPKVEKKETPEDRKKSARSELYSCVEVWNFSYPVTVRNMKEEGFTIEEIESAIEEYGVDWNEAVLDCLRSYYDYAPSSTYEDLYEHAKLNEFTDEQAEYGAKTIFEDVD